MSYFDVQVHDSVERSLKAVFEAITHPDKITGYFFSAMQGRWEEGTSMIWEFGDAGVSCEVNLQKCQPGHIQFLWNAPGGEPTEVNIYLSEVNDKKTNIRITETGFELTTEGVEKAMGQTQGWTDFICSMKAWLYTGINLRNGSYPAIPKS